VRHAGDGYLVGWRHRREVLTYPPWRAICQSETRACQKSELIARCRQSPRETQFGGDCRRTTVHSDGIAGVSFPVERLRPFSNRAAVPAGRRAGSGPRRGPPSPLVQSGKRGAVHAAFPSRNSASGRPGRNRAGAFVARLRARIPPAARTLRDRSERSECGTRTTGRPHIRHRGDGMPAVRGDPGGGRCRTSVPAGAALRERGARGARERWLRVRVTGCSLQPRARRPQTPATRPGFGSLMSQARPRAWSARMPIQLGSTSYHASPCRALVGCAW
jgi:hypothetical protein